MRIEDGALEIINMLASAGYESYFVGGCVRDLLMDRRPSDYDICTAALPQQTLGVFEGLTCYRQGEKFGTIGVVAKGEKYEITTFRRDGTYSDLRHPDNVSFCGSVYEDLARRDFTVNSIAWSPSAGFVDPFNGRDDIEAGILRCTGDPGVRFAEDALRIIRLFRFSGKLGFAIEGKTLDYAVKLKMLLSNAAPERITDEILIIVKTSANALCYAANLGILECSGIMHVNNKYFTDELPSELSFRLACVCLAAEIAPDALAERLRLSNLIISRCREFYGRLTEPVPENGYMLKKKLGNLSFCDWRMIDKAFHIWGEPSFGLGALIDGIEENREPYRISDLAVSGIDAVSAGLCGEQIGRALADCLEKVLRDPADNDREKLMEYMRGRRY